MRPGRYGIGLSAAASLLSNPDSQFVIFDSSWAPYRAPTQVCLPCCLLDCLRPPASPVASACCLLPASGFAASKGISSTAVLPTRA